MELPEAIEISKVFISVHQTTEARLGRGTKERQRIIDAQKKGDDCSSYRLNWLNVEAKKLVSQLSEVAQGFNNKFPEDQCSVQDLVDLLKITIGKLQK